MIAAKSAHIITRLRARALIRRFCPRPRAAFVYFGRRAHAKEPACILLLLLFSRSPIFQRQAGKSEK